MKKFTFILSIILLITFNINKTTATAASLPQNFSEGFYTISDLSIMQNVMYNVQNLSPNEVFMIIFDSNKRIQQSIRFEGHSMKYVLRPMKYDYKIIIIGDGSISFSPININGR
ncbi:hypothetical protein CBE01nite_01270 [Clostridium beijerinckii]|uniref:DUF3244 domain-containing protein n=1 Tax=Clostridium beijerinckii TaxID=1520 RepID=A0AB74VJQ1_CLOBE|nr:hypothetical protein [Clostridium beijerinckii]NRZ25855.1 hypothetical protein [Clostridium beijerinckii]NYB98371.1 hypothetical protein [Clostridium beijerinckii]OOM20468.1 hypothetical protein CLBEI_43990 [Clostridium beijerinckii]QUN36592.1 hypothetical protein KEC93_07165 [Clostridium beijerinckii]SQB12684.1 Uncharacterised protein [Clostridium beijerinckii]